MTNTGFYPHVPSVGVTDTSRESAEAIAPSAEVLRKRVLELIRERPSTPEELALALNESILNVRPRCSELARCIPPMIVDSKQRRKNNNNRNCIVWQAVGLQTSLF